MKRGGTIRSRWVIVLLSLPLTIMPLVHADEEEEEEEGPVELVFSAKERAELGIVTANVEQRVLKPEITATGEVMLNAYRTAQVAPRIDAQVVERHARMGDVVKAGAPLVTLSTVDMAEAMGDLLVADREWQRVSKLGRMVVSETRFVEAQVNRQQAYARVLANGMPKSELQQLLREADASRANGEYTLYAPFDGVVIRDAFVVGEVVDAGQLLMELSDLSTLWVEARVDPDLAAGIAVEDAVRVNVAGDAWIDGRVVQKSPHLSEATRTAHVRVEVANTGKLSPGQFANVAIATDAGPPMLAVPRDAVVLILGTPMVFALEGEEFEPRPVETGLRAQEWTAITAGLKAGEEIAVKGVFQLKSLLLKSKIGDTD